MSWPHCCSLEALCTCAFLFGLTPRAPKLQLTLQKGLWELLDAGFSFLVAASHQHLNREHDKASVLIPMQTQLPLLGLARKPANYKGIRCSAPITLPQN